MAQGVPPPQIFCGHKGNAMETECGLTVYSCNASWKHLLAFRNASQGDRAKALATSKLEYCRNRTLPEIPSVVHWLQQRGHNHTTGSQLRVYRSPASNLIPLQLLYQPKTFLSTQVHKLALSLLIRPQVFLVVFCTFNSTPPPRFISILFLFLCHSLSAFVSFYTVQRLRPRSVGGVMQFCWLTDSLVLWFIVRLAAWLRGHDVGLWLAAFSWFLPDLWLNVTTLWSLYTVGQPTRPTQPSIPSIGKWVVIHALTWITGVDTIERQTWAAYGCLLIGQILWARA